MTESEAKELVKEFLKDYCNKDWMVKNPDYDPTDPASPEYIEQLPAGITLAIDKIWEFAVKGDLSKQSETLGDYSVTYSHATNWANWPSSIFKMVNNYRGLKWE